MQTFEAPVVTAYHIMAQDVPRTNAHLCQEVYMVQLSNNYISWKISKQVHAMQEPCQVRKFFHPFVDTDADRCLTLLCFYPILPAVSVVILA